MDSRTLRQLKLQKCLMKSKGEGTLRMRMSYSAASDELFSTTEMVLLCLEKCKEHGWLDSETRVLEPSSGDGIFYRHFRPECLTMTCFDIKPRHEECVELDFLKFQGGNERIDLVVGNPPFGRRNQLAVGFLNKSFQLSPRCAFILPLSFLRPSTIDLIDRRCWIKEFYPLPSLHFRIPESNKTKKIGCGLFLWEVREVERPLFKEIVNIKTEPCTVKTIDEAEYAVIHSGGGSGRIVKPGEYSKGTTYLLKGKRDKVAAMNWTRLSKNGGAGQLSLTLTDIHLAIKMDEMGLDYQTGALGYLKYAAEQQT